MNELMLSLSDEESALIGNELNRLFLFQDRPFGKEKQSAFIDEIRGWGFPAGAIISGIRKLMSEDLKSLKIATIKDAASDFVHIDAGSKTQCKYCDMRGVVLMKDENNYEFALACICGNGERRRDDYSTWNGQKLQLFGGRTLTFRFSEFLLV